MSLSLRWMLFAALLATLFAAPTEACNTPVYRYALYRWQPAPYELYYFHSGEPAATDRPLHETVFRLSDDLENETNLTLQLVDVDRDPELKTLPPDVRDLWQKGEQTLPAYLLVTPEGVELHRGAFAEPDLQALVNSPARQEIIKHLADARAGVFVLLTSDDEPATAEAERLLKQIVGEVESGELKLYDPEENASDASPAAESDRKPPLPALVRIVRNDPKEAWLIRQLLAVEPDLPERREPMVFAAFGRARVMPPYLARGINYENLVDCLHYVTGACACTVKEQNPGFELITQHTWRATSEAMARRFNAEEGSGLAFRDLGLFPELTPEEPADEGVTADEAPIASEAATTPSDVLPDAVSPAPPQTPAQVSAPAPSPAPLTATSHNLTRGDDRSNFYQVLGVGLALLVGLIAITTWTMRSPG